MYCSLTFMVLYQLCDAFIELVKPAMFGEDEELKKNAQDSFVGVS